MVGRLCVRVRKGYKQCTNPSTGSLIAKGCLLSSTRRRRERTTARTKQQKQRKQEDDGDTTTPARLACSAPGVFTGTHVISALRCRSPFCVRLVAHTEGTGGKGELGSIAQSSESPPGDWTIENYQ